MAGVFADKIPQHRHCEECGTAFVGEGNFCSEECKETAGIQAKKKLKKLGLIWVALIVITIAVIVMFGL